LRPGDPVIRLAVTGHRGLPQQTERLVDAALRAEISKHVGSELVGLSCLADGADAPFAPPRLHAGGRLVGVGPAEKYRECLPESHHATYDALIGQAAEIIELDHLESTSQAHMDASLRMLADADQLVAVWDGQPARGYGGTADVVAAALERHV